MARKNEYTGADGETLLNMPISVLIADEDANTRRCLKRAIEADGTLSVQWEADNGLQALSMIQQSSPDVVLIACQLQRMSGIEVTRCVRHKGYEGCTVTEKSSNDDVRVVVMSVYETDREAAMQAGADAFLVKDCGCTAIRSTLQSLVQCKA